MPTDPEPTTTQPHKPQDDTIKETFESIVIAFILAFVFRAYVVEAFVIPTGSMAPTLLGEHLRITCDQCGYHYKVDSPAGQGVTVENRRIKEMSLDFHCPMCQQESTAPPGTFISSGDRILVHKYLYSLSEPKRWDVVVFKAPHRPQTNYIKRLVGLPGQQTMILEGNVYFNPTPGTDAGWRIARKTDPDENAHAESVQRTVWQHVYHSQYVPLNAAMRSEPWRSPWVIAAEGEAEAAGWKRGGPTGDDNELDPSRGFVFDSAGKGALRFAFPRVFNVNSAMFFPYGQRRSSPPIIAVEEVRLAAAIEPRQDGLRVTLRTSARLDDKAGLTHNLSAIIDAQGNATLWRSDVATPLAAQNIGAMKAGETRIVELWYVDQEASLWVDGERVLSHRFDGLTYDDLLARAMPFEAFEGGPTGAMAAEHKAMDGFNRRIDLHVPVVKIEVEGSPVTLHRVELDRDLYYTSSGKGTVTKQREGNSPWGTPVTLKADEFFCLGDNSPYSADSRAWDTVDPWVLARSFAEGSLAAQSQGVVPRRLMMGKAFFVYFPTMIGTTPQQFPYFPNFGEMRFIH